MTTALLFIATKQRITISHDIFPYTPPRIATPADESLDKPWYVEYYIWDYSAKKKRRKRVVLNHNSANERYREGHKISNEILSILEKGAYVNGPKLKASLKQDSILIQAFEYYLYSVQNILKQSSYSSIRTHIRRLNNFLKFKNYDHIKVQNFTNDHAVEYADYMNIHLEISNRTINNNIAELSTVFNWFIKRKLISDNPFRDFSKLPAPAKRHTAFRPEQVAEFKSHTASDPQLWLFVQFVYYCAIRPRKELRLLKIKDIEEKAICISSETAKSSRKDYIRIPEPLEKEIQKFHLRSYNQNFYVFGANGYPGEKPTYANQIYRRHRTVLEQIGAQNQDVDLYSWKHTGAIALWNATQNIQLLKEHLRHTDIASTIKYLRDLGQFTDYSEVNKFPSI